MVKKIQTPPQKKCLTDNGKQFVSSKFDKLLSEYQIEHVTSAPYNPTGNSIVERANKEMGLVLRLAKNLDLTQLEKNIWIRFNCTYNKTIGKCPYEIFNQESIFKNNKRKCITDLQNVSERIKKLCDKYNEKINKKKKYNFKINE
ncbi:Gag-Pro-Pol polyprotein, partial [Dictyocoela muelleri]